MDSAIIKALQAAGSQNVEHVKQAEIQLKEWEINPGFYPKLLEIFLMRNIGVNVRWIAIIYLKNGINKYWRRTGKIYMTDDEKTYIRNNITIFDEGTPELALQLAVVIGRIARSDIKSWPNGLHLTLEAIKSENELSQHRALLTLNQIAKELASKRLVSDRRVFQEISANTFTFLQQLCYHHAAKITNASTEEDSLKALELSILITKVLRKLLIYGASTYSAESDQIRHLKWCIEHVNVFFTQRCACHAGSRKQDKVGKLLLILMKILSEFEEHHFASILPVLLEITQLSLHFVLSNTNTSDFPMLPIYAGNLLRSISRKCTKIEKSTASSNSPPHRLSSARDIILNTFNEECIKTLAQHLVMNFFPLTNEEMEEWGSDPEGYVHVDAGESHKFLIRPCTETLYVGLFYDFKNFLIPFVVNLVQEVNRYDMQTSTQTDLLKICAIFKAVGLASYELFGDIDFDAWFVSALIPLFNLPSQSFSILQQHVMWMIGEWINVKFSKTNRVSLYKLISAVLTSKDTDLVLKLTACKTLRAALDDFDFVLDDFHPCVNDIFIVMCQLLMHVEQCDTKMMVLNIISIMIERVGEKVHRNADMLLHYLPQLWELSGEHNLLRGAVMDVLHHLIKGLGIEGSKIDHMTLPIIHHSTSIDQPAHIYLLEDGLELWHSVMKNSTAMKKEMLEIYKNIFALFERASETLDTCLAITRAYLLLDANAFLQEHSQKLSQCFTELRGNIKEEPASKIAKILKLIIQLQPAQFMEKFQSNVLDIFGCSVKDENYPPLMTQYLSTVAYIVIHQTEGFYKVGQVYAQLHNSSYEDVMGRLFDVWLDKIDCMMIHDKKLSAIALVSLLPHKIRFVADRFALVLDVCVNVIYDLQKTQVHDPDDEQCEDSLVVDWSKKSHDVDDDDQTAEDIKERKLLSQDPVYSINLLHFIRDKLNETKAAYGEQLFNEAMQTMDSTVAKQLLALVR